MISVPSVKPFAVRSPMAEYMEFVTTRSTGTWGGLNTAYVGWKGSANLTVEWSGTGWSGGNATEVYSGLPASVTENYAYISRAVSGAGNKTIRFYPTDTSGRRIGSLTQIAFIFSSTSQTTTPLASVDLKNARELQSLTIDGRGTGLTSVDVSDMKKLVSFSIMNGTGLTYVNVTNCTSLYNLYLSNLYNITSVTGLSSLKNNLQSLSLENCTSITSLDVSDFGYLYNLGLLGCLGLTTLRAQNVMLYTVSYVSGYGYAYSLNGGANLQSTGLTGGGLNQFYTDLATETTPNPAIIAVFGAAGAQDSDPSIATAKNYTVIGNLPP